MARNSGGGVSLVIIAILALLIGWFGHQYLGDTVAGFLKNIPTQTETKIKTDSKKEDEALCAQVITPARNPATGEIKEFPTPCDVPEGWMEIQNDVPGL